MAKQSKAVGAELANSENNIEVLTAFEWKQAAGIVEVLGPLADTTKEISGDSYPTSSVALKSHFSFYDSDPIFCPSMLCNPRFRGVLIDYMVAVNTLAIEIKKLSDKSSLEMNNPRVPLLVLDYGRGRENKENERNLDEGRDGYRRGGGRMMNGPGRGRGGRGGGRLGPRTFQSREKGGFSRPIETWTGSEDTSGESLKMENLGNEFSSTEDWDSETIPGSGTNVGTGNVSDKWGDDFPSPEDWDNEEYTGSLADSKVFTSSGGTLEPVPSNEPLVDLAAQNLSSSVASSSSQMSQSIDIHQAQSQLSQVSHFD
ncbi:unnamed protein product [Timema podura]|uniref:Uncharacterized protein n=1 Tax=Timema podura TaxID=61482 RepID=A0ABN7P141_TIMPD|nr:unnamed protein product [Timema podura]